MENLTSEWGLHTKVEFFGKKGCRSAKLFFIGACAQFSGKFLNFPENFQTFPNLFGCVFVSKIFLKKIEKNSKIKNKVLTLLLIQMLKPGLAKNPTTPTNPMIS